MKIELPAAARVQLWDESRHIGLNALLRFLPVFVASQLQKGFPAPVLLAVRSSGIGTAGKI